MSPPESLRWPTPTRDHVGARILGHPVVVDVEGRRAARGPRRVRDAPAVDLELGRRAGRCGVARRSNSRRRPARDVLGSSRAPAASPPPLSHALAHLDGRGVEARPCCAYIGCVERPPVVPAFGLGRAGRVAVGADAARPAEISVGAPVVDRALNLESDRIQRGLVRVDPPPGSTSARGRTRCSDCEASSSPRSASGWRSREGRALPAPAIPASIADGRLRLRLRLCEEVPVQIEAVAVGPRPPRSGRPGSGSR